MATITKAQQQNVLTLIADFELDGSTDYARMSSGLIGLGLQPNNKFIWACINKVVKTAVEYDTDFLD